MYLMAQVQRGKIVVQRTQIGKREQVQVLDQSREPAGFLCQRVDAGGRQWPNAVLERFDFRTQGGQRRAQFVCDVGDPSLAGVPGVFQRAGEVVEVGGQLRKLVMSGDGDACAVIAFRQPVGTLAQRVEAARNPVGDQRGIEYHGGQHAGGDDQETAGLLFLKDFFQRFDHRQARNVGEVADNPAIDFDWLALGVGSFSWGPIRTSPCTSRSSKRGSMVRVRGGSCLSSPG